MCMFGALTNEVLSSKVDISKSPHHTCLRNITLTQARRASQEALADGAPTPVDEDGAMEGDDDDGQEYDDAGSNNEV